MRAFKKHIRQFLFNDSFKICARTGFFTVLCLFLTGCFSNIKSFKRGALIGLVLCLLLTGCLSNPYKRLNRFELKTPFSHVTELVHKQSGARLVLVKNSDPARSFNVAFRTPPYDNTGLFHVFEHAVLSGSRLYPSKLSFDNARNFSTSYYASAGTERVFTFYDFSSRLEKDFENLLSVYMDAVFFPKAVTDPRIIQKERRYEMDPTTGALSLNGVAFSEMKGRYSIPYLIFNNFLNSSLLPKTPYSYNSGGHPEEMAALRFQQVQEAHKKYYHPQNALIFLYGDLDFKKTLSAIDQQFLSFFKKDEDFKAPAIPLQGDLPYSVSAFKESLNQPMGLRDSDSAKSVIRHSKKSKSAHLPQLPKEEPFSNSADEAMLKASYPSPEGPDKDWFAEGWVLGSASLPQTTAFYIIMSAFASHASAPLKLSILKKGLAQSVEFWKVGGYYGMGGRNNAMAFVFKGTDKPKITAIRGLLQREIERAANSGLNEKLLRSAISQYEFQERETKHNAGAKGLKMGKNVVYHWMHWSKDIPLSEYMDMDKNIKEAKALLADKNFVKSFFEKHLKNNLNRVTMRMLPDPEHSKKFNQKLKQQVSKALEEKLLSEYQKEDRLFREWVSAKESQAIINKTPALALSDIKADDQPIPSRRYKKGSYELVEYPSATAGISYIRLFFDLQGLKEEDIKLLRFFISLLKKTDTKNYAFKDLSRQIGVFAGAFDFNVTAPQSAKDPQKFKPLLKVSLSFLNENHEKNAELLREVLLYSRFLPENRTGELLNELKSNLSSGMIDQIPNLISLLSHKKFFPLRGGFLNQLNGGAFYEYVLKSDWDSQKLVPRFQALLADIFNQKRLRLVAVIAEKTELKKLISLAEELKSALPLEGSKDQDWLFAGQKSYTAYAIPGEMQYLNETASFKDEGLKYSGPLLVYKNYMNMHFMQPRIRQEAGAYGAWNYFQRNGLWTLESFRDPHLKKSFDAFAQAVDFMKNETITIEKLKPFIIGALWPFYKDQSTAGRADFMTSLYLRDLSWSDYIQTKKEILATRPESFERINQALASALKKSHKAVAGHADKIKAEAGFAKEILSLP